MKGGWEGIWPRGLVAMLLSAWCEKNEVSQQNSASLIARKDRSKMPPLHPLPGRPRRLQTTYARQQERERRGKERQRLEAARTETETQ